MIRATTREIGGSALARSALAGGLQEWYAPRLRDPVAWRSAAFRVADDFQDRSWLDDLLPAFDPSGAAADRLRSAAESNGLVVTGGQQPGLFGGPLYVKPPIRFTMPLVELWIESVFGPGPVAAAGVTHVMRSRATVAVTFVHGTPSIVIGVFAWTWVVASQKHFSGFAGGVALAILMVPMVMRTTEEMIKLVPHSLREAALALGYSRWRTTLEVVRSPSDCAVPSVCRPSRQPISAITIANTGAFDMPTQKCRVSIISCMRAR